MARRRHQNAISLFPFLAVLVCTMGALILLLLATTRRIRNDQRHAQFVQVDERPSPQIESAGLSTSDSVDDPEAKGLTPLAAESLSEEDGSLVTPEAVVTSPKIPGVNSDHSAVAVRQTKIEDLQELLAQESERHRSLQHQVDTAKNELKTYSPEQDDDQTGMSELTALRSQQTKLAQELDRRNGDLAQLQSALETSSEKTEQAEGILSSRESALISLRQIAKQAEQQTPALGTDQTIVEFTNSTGTRRSPILIDVTENGFEFQPAGITITTADMQGFPSNDNPLISGVLGVHEWRHGGSLSVKPYVLLLVRPDGSLPYYAAQRFLTQAGIHFGYELLEQNKQISAGQPDIEERNAVRDAVLSALTRRQNLYGGLSSRIPIRRDPRTTSKSRQVRVLPDGRVLFGDELNDAVDGRFYAGGEAPPSRLRQPAIPSKERADPNGVPGNYDAVANAGRATGGRASEFDANNSDPMEAQPHLPRAGDHDNLEVSIVPRATVDGGDGNASQTAEFELGEPGGFDVQQSLSKRRLLSEDRGISDGASIAPPKGSLARNAPQRFNAIDPSVLSGWPTSEYAHSESATRTAGPAEDSALSDIANMNFGAVAGNTAASRSQVPGRPGNPMAEMGAFGTPQQTFDYRAQPDPFLRAMLNGSRAKASAGLISRVPVTVFVDASALTVGAAATINTAGWDVNQIMAATLQGLSHEMKFAPSINDGYSLPMVRFVVSPGATLTQLQLARQLKQAGIPCSAVTVDRLHSPGRVLFEGQLDVPENDPRSEPEVDDRVEPADPIPPSGILRLPRRDRRLAI
ncbi:MAG: hypothetical protein ABGZ53_00345 [Fuerstiella sp.]